VSRKTVSAFVFIIITKKISLSTARKTREILIPARGILFRAKGILLPKNIFAALSVSGTVTNFNQNKTFIKDGRAR